MTEGERGFAFQMVRLKILQIFDECDKFDESDKKALYEVMGSLLLQRIRSIETPTPAIELTNAAPTDDCSGSAKMIPSLPRVDVNAAFPMIAPGSKSASTRLSS
jgi:hypothetical protein